MKTIKGMLLSMLALFIVFVLASVYFIFLFPLTLPEYELFQNETVQHGYATTSLKLGKLEYINDITEIPLEPTGSFEIWKKIGRSTWGSRNIYPVPGQSTLNYLVAYDGLFPPMVFRNEYLPPVEISSFLADEVQLRDLMNDGKRTLTTRDERTRSEVVDYLARREGMVTSQAWQPQASIYLLSVQLPGLAYVVFAAQGTDGKVYLCEKRDQSEWIPAGPAFAEWFRQWAGGKP